MKHSFLLRAVLVVFLGVTMSVARAQYVPIPDVNFGNWLNNNMRPVQCMIGNSAIGWQLDTTCTSLDSMTEVWLAYNTISNLTGIQYFRNLQVLDCGYSGVTFIPPLPATLRKFYCDRNSLTNLPTLPNGLFELICDQNLLTTIPTLPDSLRRFTCARNQLTSLPVFPPRLNLLSFDNNRVTSLPPLPDSLTFLRAVNNLLQSIPALPAGLQSLYCSGNLLTSLPPLPDSLKYLECAGNQLTVLPTLPDSLKRLICNANQITSLPTLPSGLQMLWCGRNPLGLPNTLPPALSWFDCSYLHLTTLPPLPARLTKLYCDHNQLTSLPAFLSPLSILDCQNNLLDSLPSLFPIMGELNCDSNRLSMLLPLSSVGSLQCRYNPLLTCLPPLPQSYPLSVFYIAGTNIHCLPNRFATQSYDIDPASLPLCDASSGCEFYYNIAGSIHQDTSASCSLDSIYPGAALSNIKMQLIENGQVAQQFYAFNSGGYSFKADSFATYTVRIDTTGLPLSIACPSTDSYIVYLSGTDSVATNRNFSVKCSNYDCGVLSIYGRHFRPGQYTTVDIVSGDIALLEYNAHCSAGIGGTVTTIVNAPAHYVSSVSGSLPPSSISGDTLTYSLSDLDSLQMGSLSIVVAIDTNAVVGTDVCFTTIITPSVPDMNPANDILEQCFPVVNSWDPNEKTVYPTDTFSAGQWLTYTVEFQNTGTDTAYTVVVRDTLSPYVDASTFQYVASDHKAVIQLMGNAMTFTFPKINLVDSATNPALSTGWIQYKVKAQPNLPINTQVKNTAFIYFDLNPAVVTNTTVNTLAAPSGIGTIVNNNAIALYPNPNKGSFTLSTVNGQQSGSSYTISDMLGNVVMTETIHADRQAVMMPADAAGVYTLTVKGAQPIRFVVVR